MMKVMRWPLKSPVYKKFRIKLTLHRCEKLLAAEDGAKFVVDIKWRGPKRALGPRFRSIKRERSSEVTAAADGILKWEQEFECECALTFVKESGYQLWDVYLCIRKVTQNGSKRKSTIVGTSFLNLGEFAPHTGSSHEITKIPILFDDSEAALVVSVSFLELRMVNGSADGFSHRITAPAIPCINGSLSWENDDRDDGRMNAIKSIITIGTKKFMGDQDGRSPSTSEISSQDSPDRFDSDSGESFEDNDDEVDEKEASLQNYGSLAVTNLIIEAALVPQKNDEELGLFNGSAAAAAVAVAVPGRLTEEASSSDSDQTSSMRRMLSWRKRKLSFRSPRARGEPLLNKAYGDNGGDEIDWDRRQCDCPIQEPMTSMRRVCEETKCGWDFGESFKAGSWETKKLVSRDGQMKLSTKVFFASIDQRNESAAGESACTALVAVVADWLHQHSGFTPSRAELDLMIREGSAEWRKLCNAAIYKDRFPDGHFDLETVIEAGVRALRVVPEKSFVGFFLPQDLNCSSDFQFLEGAMSFDNIWEEIGSEAGVYVVSWNDHFFVLKVGENDCWYIIDTLGERLYEGCDQAYLLKFDRESCLSQQDKEGDGVVPGKGNAREDGVVPVKGSTGENGECPEKGETADEEGKDLSKVVYRGRDACREFLKGFFAAVPLRELESDIRKGLVAKDHLHKRLQIEFHFTLPVVGTGII